MECLAQLCFITAVYVQGGLGAQTVDAFGAESTNDYHYLIGELSLVVEMGDHWYMEAKHISGLNTEEMDGGLNAVLFGARIQIGGNK